MKLQDYLLTLFMEESSESINAASKIIRYGKNYKFPKYGDMTTEDILYSEFGDCLACIILLNSIGILVAPLTSEFLFNKDESVLKEMEYRINNIFSITESNLSGLEINPEDFEKFKQKVLNKLDRAKESIKRNSEDKKMRTILSKKY